MLFPGISGRGHSGTRIAAQRAAVCGGAALCCCLLLSPKGKLLRKNKQLISSFETETLEEKDKLQL